jgi:hypothetical protein
MKLKIFYAACIAVIALSCGNKMQEVRTTSDDITLAKPEETKPAASFNEKNNALKSTVERNEILTADTVASQNDTDKIVLQSGGPDWDKKIIKTANVILELKDYNAYNTVIHLKLKSFGAYVAQEQQSENDEQISNNISIKVPVDKFDEMMNSLSGDDVKVLEKNISTEDVTGEVVDTKARIEAKQQARARYLELLKQAKNMNDILQVQNEINSIQEEIESASGRVNYLVHASAYSTINVRYYQYLNGLTSKDVEPNFYSRLNEAFKTGASVIINLILFVISVWPLAVAAIVLIIYFKRSKLLNKVQNVQVSDTTKAQ